MVNEIWQSILESVELSNFGFCTDARKGFFLWKYQLEERLN